MVADIYRKDGHWRLASNLQGFNDGLAALVKHFGGEVSSDDAIPAAPTPVQTTLSLEKKVETAATQLVSLAKKAQVSLEKAKLTHVKARVALILDASGSMNFQYTQGRVQEVVNRVLPLAIHFDDDGSIDCWAFAAKPQKLSAITLANYSNFIQTDNHGWRSWDVGSRSNDEPKVMEQVIMPTVRGMAAEGNVYTGFLYAGLMIDGQGNPKVIEFNCRFGDPETQPIMLRMRSDLVELCLAACAGKLDQVEAIYDPRVAIGVVLAAGGYPGDYQQGKPISGLPVEEASGEKVFHAGSQLAGDTIVTAGGRVLCATALGHTVAEAQQRAYQLAGRIQWDGVFYRKDIGWRAIEREQAK